MIIIPQYSNNKLPKTGQTVSYLTSDDGDIELGRDVPAVRFEKINTGGKELVKDHHTGLMWPKIITVTNNAGAGIKWADAFAAKDASNSNNFGGFNDWRIPNIAELLSLFNYGTNNYFSPFQKPDVNNNCVWSSTTAVSPTTYAWFLGAYGPSPGSKTELIFQKYTMTLCRSFK